MVAHIPVTHERGLRTRSDSRAAERRFRLEGGGVVDGWRGGGCAHYWAGMYGGYNVVVEIRTTTSRDLHLAPPTQPATTEPFYSSDS